MSILRHPLSRPALLVAVVAGLAAWLVGGGPIVGLVVAVAGGSLFAVVVARRVAGTLRRGIGARPARVGEFPRLHNTVDGLCLTHGIEPPELAVVDSTAGNALVLSGAGGAEVVLTTGAVDHLGLVELESLVAHLLVRTGDPGLRASTVRAGMGPMRVLAGSARDAGAGGVLEADVAGADLTRFPPGMQDALRALVALGSGVEAPSGSAPLWLLQPDGRTDEATADHLPVGVRIDALGER